MLCELFWLACWYTQTLLSWMDMLMSDDGDPSQSAQYAASWSGGVTLGWSRCPFSALQWVHDQAGL